MKKILTIDGGGIKGAFPASFLSNIEDAIGDKISNYFDLIAGTSTGGIIALGLGLEIPAKDILSFYEKHGPEIFGGNRMLRFIRHFFISKYSAQPLKRALSEIMKDRILGECKTRLVIPSFNIDTGEVHVYKTAHHERFERDYKEKVVDIAMATASAPSYFPTFRADSGIPLIDGGVWANNPLVCAITEAVAVLQWPKESIKILSLGCTSSPLNLSLGKRLPFGWSYWAEKLAEVFSLAQSSAAVGTAQLFVGSGNLVRISPTVPNGMFGIDSVNEIASLKGLGSSEARKALPNVRNTFFQSRIEMFEPFRKIEVPNK